MNGARFTIRHKIIWGFITLIFIFGGLASYSVFTSYKGNIAVNHSKEVIEPASTALDNFILLVTRSKMLITNWVYMRSNEKDRAYLKALHNYQYFEVKGRLIKYASQIEFEEEIVSLDSTLGLFEEVLAIEQDIMTSLERFEDYEDPGKKFLAEEMIESEVIPATEILLSQLSNIKESLKSQKDDIDEKLIDNFAEMIIVLTMLGLALLVIGLVFAFSIAKTVTEPIKYLRAVIDRLRKGELVKIDTTRILNDEIGDMAVSISSMAEGLDRITSFAESIGDGKYDVEFNPLSDKDVLGNALLEMQSKLRTVAQEDKKRNWSTSGLAQFGEILRSSNDNFEKLSNDIISNLVKYIEANQGALFIVDPEHEAEGEHMELAACYAWDKKKFLEKKIQKGEGLSGQAWLEGDIIYLTDVPDSYVSISSGLGESNPRSILIVPLRLNDEIHGVIEIASFKTYEQYEIEFIEKIGESIAATISSVKVNEKTARLLDESTMMTEQMRAQEEEMRQNMEALQATQDKIQRDQIEREAKERILLSGTLVFELNNNFLIQNTNENAVDVLKYGPEELDGKRFKDIMQNSGDLMQIKDFATDDTFWNGTLILKDKDGGQIKLLVSAGKVTESTTSDSIYLIYGKDTRNFIEE